MGQLPFPLGQPVVKLFFDVSIFIGACNIPGGVPCYMRELTGFIKVPAHVRRTRTALGGVGRPQFFRGRIVPGNAFQADALDLTSSKKIHVNNAEAASAQPLLNCWVVGERTYQFGTTPMQFA